MDVRTHLHTETYGITPRSKAALADAMYQLLLACGVSHFVAPSSAMLWSVASSARYPKRVLHSASLQ